MSKVDAAQAAAYRDGKWLSVPAAPKTEPMTFEEYILATMPARDRDRNTGEIFCPVCSYAGREQMLSDRIRIYHPARLIPCRAPEGYEPVQEPHEQLVPA